MESIYIWGIGARYLRNEKRIKSLYKVEGFVDNKISKYQNLFDNKKVINSNQISSNMTILIMPQNFVDMAYELINKDHYNFMIGIMEFPENLQEELLSNGKFVVREDCLVYVSGEKDYCIKSQDNITKLYKEFIREKYINAINKLALIPTCRDFGISRGTPIDRIYIEAFLEKNKMCVAGDVIEIAENTYSLRYGEDRINNSYILHVNGWGENAIKGNLETGEGLGFEKFDTAIITQTLMFTFDLKKVAQNIYKMLKKGGCALITVSGISQVSRYDEENWGSFWLFNRGALTALFEPIFGRENVEIESYGNVKTATAFLYGLCKEECDVDIFEYNDVQYPVILGIKLKKE